MEVSIAVAAVGMCGDGQAAPVARTIVFHLNAFGEGLHERAERGQAFGEESVVHH